MGRGPVHQEPGPPLPRPIRLHAYRPQHPHRGFPPTRTPRPTTPRPHGQRTSQWKARCAVRSGVESTVNEFAHGHGMPHCRYHGQEKADVQHVLTSIAVTIERLSGLPPTAEV
ncbi:transposase [Streptomyces tauricus]|uniref:transposase n=1 Tax=Streptomyces tauricus TaxID=68274 RepID=UPI0027E472E0|nr:transposase [Streptomyces tauricus]